MGAMRTAPMVNDYAAVPGTGTSRSARRRRALRARAVGVDVVGTRNLGGDLASRGPRMPRTNTDGTLTQPGQAMEDHFFGSSSAEHSPYGMVQAGNGIKQAVAAVVGSTPTGRAWAISALHPCGAGEVISSAVGEVVGMCDTMTGSVATPTLRGENHIQFVKSLFPNPALPNLGTTTYGVDLIIPPVPEIDFIYRLIDDATNTKSPWVAVRLMGYDLPAYVNDDGVLTLTDETPGMTFSSSGYGKARIIAMGHTIELDAGDLANQGRVVVGQMEGQWRNVSLNAPEIDTTTGTFVTAVDPTTTGPAVTSVRIKGSDDVANLWVLNVPTDPTVITANCPGAYQGLAKHGCYVVSKFTSPLLGYGFKRTAGEEVFDTGTPRDTGDLAARPWFPQSGFAIVSSGRDGREDLTNADGFYVGDNDLRSGLGQGTMPLRVSTGTSENIAQSTIHPFAGEPSDMMTAVCMFRNLPVAGANGLTASLRVKSRTFFEAISNGSNPAVAPYIHPPAQFDFQALNSVIVAGKQLGDGYPACYNSLGSILNKIWSALRGTSSIVGGLGIPILSDIGRLTNTTMTGIDNIAGMF